MKDDQIAVILTRVAAQLTIEARSRGGFGNAKAFEERVRETVNVELNRVGARLAEFADQDFPDIVCEDWGIEVKHTKDDKWRTVANSVFEGHRKSTVERVYLIFCKMGGTPEVQWGRYEDCVVHVRTSHRPRYEVEIGGAPNLFETMGVTYATFRGLAEMEKMKYIREYARSRLSVGEHLWWLGDDPEEAPHTLPIAPKLYTHLSKDEKWKLRSEVAFLCPEIVRSGRSRKKYEQPALYLMTYHGVLASQARDLFSAGSVAIPGNKERGGNYVLRALKFLEPQILLAAERMEAALIEEYWAVKPRVGAKARIKQWLELADGFASDWTPSRSLFRDL